MPTWTYDSAAHTYRPTGGDPLSAADLRGLRDSFLTERKSATADLASRLASGDLTLGAWEVQMREQVKSTFLGEAMFGAGGREQMTFSAWGATGNQIKSQYQYLHQFAGEIAEGQLSEAAIAARAAMYVSASTQAYEKQRAGSYGLELDQHPGDGQTPCLSSCGCSLSIDEDDEGWDVYWLLSSGKSCAGCEDQAATWNPLRVVKGEGRSLSLNGNGRAHAHAV